MLGGGGAVLQGRRRPVASVEGGGGSKETGQGQGWGKDVFRVMEVGWTEQG